MMHNTKITIQGLLQKEPEVIKILFAAITNNMVTRCMDEEQAMFLLKNRDLILSKLKKKMARWYTTRYGTYTTAADIVVPTCQEDAIIQYVHTTIKNRIQLIETIQAGACLKADCSALQTEEQIPCQYPWDYMG